MAQIKTLSEQKMRNFAGSTGLNVKILNKDFHVTAILYLLKDIEGIYFKGGTALQKIFLDYARLSEDVDYSCTRDIAEIRKDITKELKKSGLFNRVTKDKDVDIFLRLIAHYTDHDGTEEVVFIDLNKKSKIEEQPEKHSIRHFYKENIPDFSVNTLSRNEMMAEKMAATIGRNKPRDHFDLYKILHAGIRPDLELVKKKCESSGHEFNIIKMFNRAKKLKQRWDKDLLPLINEEVPFDEVIRTLARSFNLKYEREKRKDKKK